MPRKRTKAAHKGLADDPEQARLHAAVVKLTGSISGGDPYGSEKVRETVRKRLLERQRLGRV